MEKDIGKLVLFDTSICSTNVGDQIIMDYCKKILFGIFPMSSYLNISTHSRLDKHCRLQCSLADYSIICGTNLLSPNLKKYRQWKLNIWDIVQLKELVLLGVGWWQYGNECDKITSAIYRKILSPSIMHSVRDSYTEECLNRIGIKNVINTGCPTMWSLTPEHCKDIPIIKAQQAVTTLTDYNKNPVQDTLLLKHLLQEYKKVYVWLQSNEDYIYLQSLMNVSKLTIIPPNLKSYDRLLDTETIDYVGTRLHAGIRSLNKKKRTIIIAVDNRAIEIAKDTGLPILRREDIGVSLLSRIKEERDTIIHLKQDNINRWCNQFLRK